METLPGWHDAAARLMTYFTWLNEELITVPHFPAWVCDMCGRRVDLTKKPFHG